MRLIVVAIALFSFQASASESLSRALQIAKENALRSKSVDWIKTEALAQSIEKSDGEDAAIRAVVSALGDPHTRYVPPAPVSALPQSDQQKQEIAVVLPQAAGYPVLQINSWSGRDQKQAAHDVRIALDALRSSNSCGIVLDFSENQGGNMWPMLIGLSPLLSEGLLGSFNAGNGPAEQIEKRNGLIFLGGKAHFLSSTLSSNSLPIPKWIGIVIGPRSSSSGEITPLMFHGQSNVRFFGQPTSGFTTSNKIFPLPNGGRLVLTTAITQDRNGTSFPQGINPNQLGTAGISDAARWLKSKCPQRV